MTKWRDGAGTGLSMDLIAPETKPRIEIKAGVDESGSDNSAISVSRHAIFEVVDGLRRMRIGT